MRAKILFLLPLAALLFGGCGPSLPPGARPTKPTKVTVNYKGAPVEGATVTFVNQVGDAAAAYGRTDPQGVAKMSTRFGAVEVDGAVLGQHKVMVEKTESVGGAPAVSQDSPDYNPNIPPAQTKYLLPQKFSNLGTSGLVAEVTDAGPNEFTFDLKD